LFHFLISPVAVVFTAHCMAKSAASKHQDGDTESKATRVMVQLAMTVT